MKELVKLQVKPYLRLKGQWDFITLTKFILQETIISISKKDSFLFTPVTFDKFFIEWYDRYNIKRVKLKKKEKRKLQCLIGTLNF